MAKRAKVDFRLPPELLERVGVEAARLGQTRTLFVERALESALGSVNSADMSGPVARRVGGEGAPNARSPVPSRASAKEFRCPIYTCTFEAASPAAVCGRHGRKVIPV